jgi:hypothetical protein
MMPWLRRLGLALHVVFSVGWLGAVVAFLSLGIAALGAEPATSRAAYIGMNVVGGGALVPLSIATLASGVIQSLGTKWGLFRHYWVMLKLVLTVLATAALLLHQFTAIAEASKLAMNTAATAAQSVQLRQLGIQLLADAGLALLVLLTATAISIYKPWGMVGQIRNGVRVLVAAIVAIVVGVVVAHLSGHAPHQHRH